MILSYSSSRSRIALFLILDNYSDSRSNHNCAGDDH